MPKNEKNENKNEYIKNKNRRIWAAVEEMRNFCEPSIIQLYILAALPKKGSAQKSQIL
jgi:hypothetical protein